MVLPTLFNIFHYRPPRFTQAFIVYFCTENHDNKTIKNQTSNFKLAVLDEVILVQPSLSTNSTKCLAYFTLEVRIKHSHTDFFRTLCWKFWYHYFMWGKLKEKLINILLLLLNIYLIIRMSFNDLNNIHTPFLVTIVSSEISHSQCTGFTKFMRM